MKQHKSKKSHKNCNPHKEHKSNNINGSKKAKNSKNNKNKSNKSKNSKDNKHNHGNSDKNSHKPAKQVFKHFVEESYDEIRKKHKHKSGKYKDLTFWDGLILFLLLKENGVLDELLEEDVYKEFDGETDFKDFRNREDYAEQGPAKDGASGKGKVDSFDNTSDVNNKGKDYFDLDFMADD